MHPTTATNRIAALTSDAAKDKQLDLIRTEAAKCRAQLASLLRRDSDMRFPTLAQAFPNMDSLSPDAAILRETMLVELALSKRPDFHALEDYVAAARDRLTAARAERDPKVNLVLDPNGFFVNLTYSFEGNFEKGEATSAAALKARFRQR